MKIPFTKMVGTGNDFIVFDNRSKLFSGQESDFFADICRRRISVGADGVLLLEEGQSAQVRMRYFNSDGLEAPMCGNGARCVGYFARKKRVVQEDAFSLEASDGLHRVRVKGSEVTLEMVRPAEFRTGFGILRESEFTEGGFLNTGVPHYVIFVQDVNRVDVERVGPFYRKHVAFPQGANINFCRIVGGNRIQVRTYERGVEKETLSCGTGCVASALITAKQYGYRSPIAVLTRGGELMVRFDEDWNEVTLSAAVEVAYEGILLVSPDRISG